MAMGWLTCELRVGGDTVANNTIFANLDVWNSNNTPAKAFTIISFHYILFVLRLLASCLAFLGILPQLSAFVAHGFYKRP